MIVVDTSVWADFFNGSDNPHVKRLDSAFAEQEDVVVLPIIVTEVLQGFRTDTGFRRARDLLLRLPIIDLPLDGYVAAALLFRSLRARGVTIRGAVDCVISHACLDHDADLLSSDEDFVRIASLTELRLCRV
jgi:predicted nucleic acid-binding protein